jgi:hypothetical protein
MENSEEKKEIEVNQTPNQEIETQNTIPVQDTKINSDKDVPRTTLLLDPETQNQNQTQTQSRTSFFGLGTGDIINIILAIVFGYFSTKTSNILHKISFVAVFLLTIYIVRKLGLSGTITRTPPNSVSDDNGNNLIEG